MPTVPDVAAAVHDFLDAHPPGIDRSAFLRARFDAGLACVHYPVGRGGRGWDRRYQAPVDELFAAAAAPSNRPEANLIGLGMAAPTLLAHADAAAVDRWLRPLWTGEEIWCQLFSEPGAGSDLAAVSTAARRDGDRWVVRGQKVWTSLAHLARWGLLLARTDNDAPKHKGLTYFVVDMTSPGMQIRPLRQLTGEAEFNEIHLDDVDVPDENRLGAVGDGWTVAMTTLMSERVVIGGGNLERGDGPVRHVLDRWQSGEHTCTATDLDRLLDLWVQAEALRLGSVRLQQQLAGGRPGPDGSALKLAYGTLAQNCASFELDLCGLDAARYDSWAPTQPDFAEPVTHGPGYRYLRTRANSIEGGTSEIQRNIIAERILGLPAESGPPRETPWREYPR